MFIHNFTNDVLKYDSKGNIIKLKPNTITFIDDSLIKPEKLKECFGARIDIVDNVEIIGQLFGTEQVKAEIEEEKAQAEEITEEVTEEVTEEGTEEVTEEGTEEVTEETPEEVTEEGTEEVTEEGTEEVTEEGTEEPVKEPEVKEKKITKKSGRKAGRPKKAK